MNKVCEFFENAGIVTIAVIVAIVITIVVYCDYLVNCIRNKKNPFNKERYKEYSQEWDEMMY